MTLSPPYEYLTFFHPLELHEICLCLPSLSHRLGFPRTQSVPVSLMYSGRRCHFIVSMKQLQTKATKTFISYCKCKLQAPHVRRKVQDIQSAPILLLTKLCTVYMYKQHSLVPRPTTFQFAEKVAGLRRG